MIRARIRQFTRLLVLAVLAHGAGGYVAVYGVLVGMNGLRVEEIRSRGEGTGATMVIDARTAPALIRAALEGEIVVEGKMYDVIHTERRGDSLLVRVERDSREESLVEVVSLQSGRADRSAADNRVPPLPDGPRAEVPLVSPLQPSVPRTTDRAFADRDARLFCIPAPVRTPPPRPAAKRFC